MTPLGPCLRPLSVVGMTPRSTGRSSYSQIFLMMVVRRTA